MLGFILQKTFGRGESLFQLESIVDRVKRYQNGEKGFFPDRVDVLTGGFPCQDFSIAGKRKGTTSHKNHRGDLLEPPT